MVILFCAILLLITLFAAACLAIPILKVPDKTSAIDKSSDCAVDFQNSSEIKNQTSSRLHRLILAGLFFMLIPIISLSFYFYHSNGTLFVRWMSEQQQAHQLAAAAEKLRKELGTPEQVIVRMKEKLMKDPNSVQGWYLLGRLYMSLGRSHEAATAFSKAYHLQPDNVDMALQYAQALYFANHSTLKGEAQSIVQSVLTKQPHQLAALNLLALDAYHKHHIPRAISLWQQMLADPSLSAENRQFIEQAIAEALKSKN